MAIFVGLALLSGPVWAQSEDAAVLEPAAPATPEQPQATDKFQTGNLTLVDFGLAASELRGLESVQSLRDATDDAIAELAIEQAGLKQDTAVLARLGGALLRQVSNEELPIEVRSVIGLDLLAHQVHQATNAARVAQLEVAISRQERLAILLELHYEELQKASEVVGEERTRMEQAEEDRRAAQKMLELAREREIQEQNQQIRSILVRDRELTEELVKVANEATEQLRRLADERRERAETFAQSRETIRESIATLSRGPGEDLGAVDLLFEDVRQKRRASRLQARDSTVQLNRAASERQKADDALAAARVELDENRERLSRIDETELGKHQLALIERRVQVEERRAEMAHDVVQARRQKHDVLEERVQFYHETLEELLPRISAEKRANFYSITRDENWHDALASMHASGERLIEQARNRLDQVMTLPKKVFSVTFWAWIIGLFWRMLLFPVAVYLGREYGPQLVRRLTDELLKRRFFRQRAGATIKLAEIVRALLRPGLMYIAVIVVLDYAILLLPELTVVRWSIDAVFIFWAVTTIVQVLVLPRRFRERDASAPAHDVVSSKTAGLDGLIDLVNLELTRGQKLVRSVRIVAIFWLLAKYMPELVVQLMGHTVIWYMVDRVFTWGLIGVIYYVLSTWKDDIAIVFERLAKDRLPRAVLVVKNHKDKIYGVLLIGVASLYVFGREGARLGKTWLVDTAWSKRISNFIFRKKIELQQRERDKEEADHVGGPANVPEHYREYFGDYPLIDESYMIPRQESLKRIEGAFETWKELGRQGSVVITGESGVGKTTLFNQLYVRWSDNPEHDLAYMTVVGKFTEVEQVHKFLARLFDLSSVPESRKDLLDALAQAPPRTVLLDDCHHFFLRQINGFRAIDRLLEAVNMTDHVHFWVLSMNSFAWLYLNRVRNRIHYFRCVLDINTWPEPELQDMIRRRDAMIDIPISFTDLVVAHESVDQYYEVIKTANGYFRLLHEFSQGNPRVALTFWLRSLKLDARGELQVSLFRRPGANVLTGITDQYLFALAAIAQHGCLSAFEIAKVIDLDRDFCEMALNYLEESDIIFIDRRSHRAALTPLYFRSVLKQLSDSNFLYE